VDDVAGDIYYTLPMLPPRCPPPPPTPPRLGGPGPRMLGPVIIRSAARRRANCGAQDQGRVKNGCSPCHRVTINFARPVSELWRMIHTS